MPLIPNQQSVNELALKKLVSAQLDCSIKKLTATFIQAKMLREIWRIDGGPKTLIVRLGPLQYLPDSKLLFFDKNRLSKEKKICNLIKKETSVAVPQIFYYHKKHPQLRREITVMECVPGKNLFQYTPSGSGFSIKILNQLVDALMQIHQLKGNDFNYLGSPFPEKIKSNWKLCLFYSFKNILEHLLKSNILQKWEHSYIWESLNISKNAFDSPIEMRLIHGDMFPGNLLADSKGNLTGIIDWDETFWADPLLELINFRQNYLNKILFSHGYFKPLLKPTKLIQTRLIYYNLFRGLRSLFAFKIQFSHNKYATCLKLRCLEQAQKLRSKNF